MKWEIISKSDIPMAFHTEVFTSGWSFHGRIVRMSEPVWWVVDLTETRMKWEGAGPLDTHGCGYYPNYVNGDRKPMEEPCVVAGTVPCLGSWTVCIERVRGCPVTSRLKLLPSWPPAMMACVSNCEPEPALSCPLALGLLFSFSWY